MSKGLFYSAHPFSKLILVAFLMVSSYLVTFVIAVLIAIPVYNTDWSSIRMMLENNDFSTSIELIKFLQIIYSAGLFVFPAFLTAFLINWRLDDYLYMNRSPKPITFILVCLLIFVSIPLINYLAELNSTIHLPDKLSSVEESIKKVDAQSFEMMRAFLDTHSIKGFLVNLLMIAIIPAIGEEFLFRGVVQKIFVEWTKNVHVAIWIAAVLFSMFHLQFDGFIPRIFLGALFGYLLVWSGSIWLPVLAHFVNNALAVFYYFFYNNEEIIYDLDSIGTDQETKTYLLISIVLFSLLLTGIYFREKQLSN